MDLELIKKEPVSAARPTPLLFVHGMWHAAWCWAEHFLPYFAQHGYLCYALSLRGHGASEGRERLRCTSLADYVADVAHIVSQMERPPVLVGHSMGGMIVQKYLESRRVPAAVLLASVPPRGVLLATLRVLFRHPLAFLKANLTFSLFPIISTPGLTREAFFSADIPEEKLTAYFSRMQDESYRAYLDVLALNLPRPKRVTTPMLVLGAADDALISPDEVEATARAYGTRAEVFPDMAHDMMLESGWQAVADRMLNWLEDQGL
ncbi:MAG: alpha/beta hydrolase [Chloroflexi bacterium]|nr:MAG: alpha/beta hydrolase [Chloroflexota bacterium]RLC89902.1 MAG: alpha/beta hydrolase [Chloroflexota bacterium]